MTAPGFESMTTAGHFSDAHARFHMVASGWEFCAKPRACGNLCRAPYSPVFVGISSSHSFHGLNGLWDCNRQHSVMAFKLLVLGKLRTGMWSPTDNNLGGTVNGFCRCNWSPKSVELTLGRIFRWAWSNDLSPLRAACFPLLFAAEEVKDLKYKRDSTCHCWPEDSRRAALTDWQLARKHGPQPYMCKKLSHGNLNELGSDLSRVFR